MDRPLIIRRQAATGNAVEGSMLFYHRRFVLVRKCNWQNKSSNKDRIRKMSGPKKCSGRRRFCSEACAGGKKEREDSNAFRNSPVCFRCCRTTLLVPLQRSIGWFCNALSVKHRPAGAETFYPALHSPIASAAYRTRSVRPMRSVVVDLMPLRRQMFFTVVP